MWSKRVKGSSGVEQRWGRAEVRERKEGERDDPHHTGRNYKIQALGLVVVSLPVGILQYFTAKYCKIPVQYFIPEYRILLWNMREKHLIPSITCPPISLC